ncbi:MAG: RnfABCDGE type electron transport complex subunit B [Ruminococcaceae bacterium]|nr:RnfABCDGE type electron transport complex subunit B [Oscillospiraceae bacterium]
MSPIILAVIIVSVIGLVLGIVLAIASIVMAVPVDEKAEAIEEVLPGANCGACGFSGCSGYAAALSEGKTNDTTLCAPGGADVVAAIAEVLGVAGGTIKPMSAVVMCKGTLDRSENLMFYRGDKSCKTAIQLFGGPKACNYGCLGLGDCIKACPHGAIQICDGIAVVNPLACKGCKLCVKACPKNIIEMVPLHEAKAINFCANKDKGAQANKQCKVSCIGCMKCVKICEFDAIKVENNCAIIDYNKCTGCGKCADECPRKCLENIILGGKAE